MMNEVMDLRGSLPISLAGYVSAARVGEAAAMTRDPELLYAGEGDETTLVRTYLR